MYKVTIGLEVHCEVATNSKNFSSAKNTYSEYPNENVDTVDIGLPGILPIANKEAFKKDSIISIFVLQRYIYHYICVKVN